MKMTAGRTWTFFVRAISEIKQKHENLVENSGGKVSEIDGDHVFASLLLFFFAFFPFLFPLPQVEICCIFPLFLLLLRLLSLFSLLSLLSLLNLLRVSSFSSFSFVSITRRILRRFLAPRRRRKRKVKGTGDLRFFLAVLFHLLRIWILLTRLLIIDDDLLTGFQLKV